METTGKSQEPKPRNERIWAPNGLKGSPPRKPDPTKGGKKALQKV